MNRFPLALALLIIATLITIGVMKMRPGLRTSGSGRRAMLPDGAVNGEPSDLSRIAQLDQRTAGF